MGAAGPGAGRLADRFGWRTVALTGTLLALSGVLLSLPAHIVTLVPALAMVVLGMFTGVTAAQLGVSEAGDADRGAASAAYFTLYYAAGALAGFVPGLAWQAWEWPGVAALALAALGLGLAGSARGGRRVSGDLPRERRERAWQRRNFTSSGSSSAAAEWARARIAPPRRGPTPGETAGTAATAGGENAKAAA
jgi:MFS family permease